MLNFTHIIGESDHAHSCVQGRDLEVGDQISDKTQNLVVEVDDVDRAGGVQEEVDVCRFSLTVRLLLCVSLGEEVNDVIQAHLSRINLWILNADSS